jgi:beta-lactam-binding protein with PASTA domain
MQIKNKYKVIFLVLIFANIFLASTIIAYHATIRGEMVTVPDLVGLTMEEAREELSSLKLTLKQVGVRLHDHLERGKIILQDPKADTRVRYDENVSVFLSAGKEKVTVPSMIGRTFQAINETLVEAALRKGKVSLIHTPRYAAGKIIAHNPLPEEEVGKDTQISMLVSQGDREDRYIMPDLIGRNADQVIEKLKAMDFRVARVRYEFYRGLTRGIIIGQFPPQGFPVQKRNLISFVVSK